MFVDKKVVTCIPKKITFSRALVAHAFNPSYSGGKDQEDRGWKPACEIVYETLFKKPTTKKG
jgi:hypothetical protein